MKEAYNVNAINAAIPAGWAFRKGIEISEKITKGASPKWQGFEYQNEGVLFVTSENVRDGELDISQPKYLPLSFNNKMKNSILQQGDILINIVGASIGRSCIYDRIISANINQAVCLVRTHENISKEYISFYLQHPLTIQKLFDTQSDSARPNLTLEDIRDFKFLIPPLPEQKAIAAVLSLMDSAIQKTNQLIAQKELRKKALMQQLLTGKKRLKGFGGEWESKKLGFFFTERCETGFFDLPLLSIGATGIYPQTDSIKKDSSNEDKSKYRRICKGDIGYNTMRMWQGRSALSNFEGIISPAYTVVTVKDGASAKFFSYLFKFPSLINAFYRNSQGLVDDTLNCKFKDFEIVTVYVPLNRKEQDSIAKVLEIAEYEIQLLKAKSAKLKEQKKGMMQVLLTAKKRLKGFKP